MEAYFHRKKTNSLHSLKFDTFTSFFLQFKEFEMYCGAVFLLRHEEEYWRSPFLNKFYWSEFGSGK